MAKGSGLNRPGGGAPFTAICGRQTSIKLRKHLCAYKMAPGPTGHLSSFQSHRMKNSKSSA